MNSPEQTAEQKAETMAEKIQKRIAPNSDWVKHYIVNELNLAELVKCKERCEALEGEIAELLAERHHH